MIVIFEYPSLNCKSISVIELYIFIISIMDICIYPRYSLFMDITLTVNMTMGKGLGRLMQYHLRTGRPHVC